jgi:hypothetical protein
MGGESKVMLPVKICRRFLRAGTSWIDMPPEFSS